MKILFIDTYYENFQKAFYRKNKSLKNCNYKVQINSLLNESFGTSDAYSYYLNKEKILAQDLIVNCIYLQKKWAKENKINFSNFRLKIPHKFFKIPFIGKSFSNLPGLYEIAKAQIKIFKPDILYCQDLSFFPGNILKEIKEETNIKLLVGQIACPLPPKSFLKPYDLVLTSFPHFVEILNKQGINSKYFKIGFDKRILSKISNSERDINFSFVGGISKHHKSALETLNYLAINQGLKIYGYGANKLLFNSPIRKNHFGEKWGLDMYKILSRTKISFNRHIDVSLNNANNMRLFEATGMGSLLLTDEKDNLNQLFEIDKEIVTYSCKEEASEKVKYLLENPKKITEIALAGQERTLKEHTYEIRMKELLEILKKYI